MSRHKRRLDYLRELNQFEKHLAHRVTAEPQNESVFKRIASVTCKHFNPHIQSPKQIKQMNDLINLYADAFIKSPKSSLAKARTFLHPVVMGTRLITPHVAKGRFMKTWTTQHDGKVREWHDDADGQTQRVSDPFDVMGEDLMYPGDMFGSPENVINCRCFVEWGYSSN